MSATPLDTASRHSF